mmetsp:Transcript_37041/g.44785  ORF Transcript_37041/g.44785 Transcript_37041/m.44785 type:complete len:115 (-) Transcript_37041:303-647(-)
MSTRAYQVLDQPELWNYTVDRSAEGDENLHTLLLRMDLRRCIFSAQPQPELGRVGPWGGANWQFTRWLTMFVKPIMCDGDAVYVRYRITSRESELCIVDHGGHTEVSLLSFVLC